MGSHSLFQGIFPIQGSNSGLLYCRQILYHLNHQGLRGYRCGKNARIENLHGLKTCCVPYINIYGLPWWLSGKESACNAGDAGLIPGSGGSPGGGNGYPLQYSCLENSMDRGSWQATVHGPQRGRHNVAAEHATHTHEHRYIKICSSLCFHFFWVYTQK